MKNQWRVRMALVACMMLSGCVTTSSNYSPDYDEDYIYSVSYYGYRPMNWGDGYYNNYGWGARNWNRSSGYITPQMGREGLRAR
ncbi:MAG: hypothetical protein NTW08_01470 [Gammaproteobacteria bacterium]|nr:hypothetical protein [Gammaproteobacteria bacterium]